MNEQNRKYLNNEPSERMKRTQEPKRQQEQPRLNPRLVFNDPDAFFRDLVMEQQEQM